MVGHLLMSLSKREREAFMLIYGQGFTYQEAADFMGLTARSTVSTLVKRAQQKFSGMRDLIKPRGASWEEMAKLDLPQAKVQKGKSLCKNIETQRPAPA